jgi:hypothetical protein
MQELITKLIAEVGLTSEQAQKTVTTCLTFVKSKLPPALASNVDAMFSGAQGETIPQQEETLTDKAADLAGAAKDKLEDLAGAAKDKFDDLIGGDAKEKLGDLADGAKEKFDDILNSDLGEKAKDAFGKLKGMFGGSSDKA